MTRINWYRLFTRQNLGRASKWASAAIFLSVGGFISWFQWLELPPLVGRLTSWSCFIVLEGYFAFTAAYFWRQKRYAVSAVFAALFLALPAARIAFTLYPPQQPLIH